MFPPGDTPVTSALTWRVAPAASVPETRQLLLPSATASVHGAPRCRSFPNGRSRELTAPSFPRRPPFTAHTYGRSRYVDDASLGPTAVPQAREQRSPAPHHHFEGHMKRTFSSVFQLAVIL